MKQYVIEQSKNYLRSYLKGKKLEYETLHPWRKDSEHVILHSLRVHSMALKIAGHERNKLSDDDVLLIQLSAILHDIGKCDTKESHAERSAEIVRGWLYTNPSISAVIPDVGKLLSIIKNHSNKDKPENDLCSAIIKDADILDEIGVLSIFMASNRIDRTSPYFFNELLKRIQVFELKYCDTQMSKLNTEFAKTILKDKVNFIKVFIRQLYSEINGTEELYAEFQKLSK